VGWFLGGQLQIDNDLREVEMSEISVAGPDIGPTELAYVADAMMSGWYGPNAYSYVEQFEREFAALHGRRYGLMTPNCTSALHLVLAGLNIGPGDEVVVPESTWIGSSAAVTYVHAQTVFADVSSDTWCISAETVKSAVSENTRAIVAVDLYGNMPGWSELEEFASKRGVPIIEDAAEALGSCHQGQRAGSFGIASVFSFHRTKTLSTGEGGILLLDDESLFERCKLLRDHGRKPGSYQNVIVGFKYMPSNLQAALGCGQLSRIDELIEKKRRILSQYRKYLPDDGSIQLNRDDGDTLNGAWATVAVFKSSLKISIPRVMDQLALRGIPTRNFFFPLSSLAAYAANQSGGPARNPISYSLNQRGIQLPSALNLQDEQIEFIARELTQLVY
jgi:perosamine synthetase